MTDPTPASASEQLNDALRLLTAPVAVIGAAKDGVLGGLTAAWVTRVSLEPPLLLVAVGHERFTWELLADRGEFTVSILAGDQVSQARLFGLNSRRDVDKWARTAHVLLGEGVPALEHCSVRFLCRVENRFATGDHDCFVGRVVEWEVVAGEPVLPMRGADYAPR
ncbi:MAG: flavin reductase family protein [Candidatus Krumholzibacteriota bacterium]